MPFPDRQSSMDRTSFLTVAVRLAASACLATVARAEAEPDWHALLRDPAAQPRWVAADRLQVTVREPDGPPGVDEIDAATGRRRRLTDEEATQAAVRRLGAEPLDSAGHGDDTEIVFVNGRDAAVRIFWIDHAGRAKAYGTVPPRGRRGQHTFAGHAWLVRDAAGRDLGWTRGETGRIEVTIDESQPASPPPPAEPAERRSPPLPAAAEALAGPAFWAPDSGHVVVWEVEAAQRHPVHAVESAPGDRVEPRLRTWQYLKPGDRIERRWPRLFTREGREVPLDRTLFANPWAIDDPRWSADGRTFFFVFNERGHQALRMVAIDAASGAARTVVEETSPTFVDYAHKTWHHWLSDAELLWTSERDGWNHLYLVDVATGGTRQVTDGRWLVRGVDRVDAVDRTAVLRVMGIDPAQSPYHEHVVRVPLAGGPPVRLTRGDGTHELLWSPDRRWYVDTFSRIDLPPVRELRRADDGGLVCELGRTDASGLVERGWTWPERFTAKGRDGETDIWGVIWRPRGTAGDDARRPVVECIYAGPHDFHVPTAFAVGHGQRALADAGFVVVMVDGMGTNWRGKAFHDVCWKNLKDAGLPDHVAWLKAAAAERPWMDLSRVGVYGGSAGGQNAVRALLDHPEVYHVAVADCGCHDNRMDKIWWNELWMGWPVDESYAASSNVVDAHRLRGRLMLIVGELDDNVDPASTLQLSAALVRAGRDHDLVVIPGAGHGAAETPYGSMKRLSFLKRHLLDAGR
jgi:dipeptidyl aminopeptidase/acylaminoacyl peptidase